MRCAKRTAVGGFTLVELLVVVAIVGLLVAMLLPAIQLARESARRSVCINNMRQMGLAVHMYHDTNGAFPPGGVSPGPCCSNESYTCWTIQILPFLEKKDFYDRYKQRETNEWNAKIGNLGFPIKQLDEGEKKPQIRPYFMPVYSCPSDIDRDKPMIPNSGPARDLQIPYMPGSYRGVGGKSDGSTGWWDNNPRHKKLPRRWRGVFHVVDSHLRPETFGAVTDGLSNSLMVGEYATRPSKAFGLSRRTFWAYTYGAYNRSDAVPESRTLLGDLDMCTMAGGQGGEEPCYRAWGSFHPDLFNFLLCDASVRTFSVTIDTRVFADSATIAGRKLRTCLELLLLCFCGAVCVPLAGCRRAIVPVSGRVTLDGQPLAGAVVTFQPQVDRKTSLPNATGSVGRTDSDGKFSLRLVRPERSGAAVGTHIVTISTAVGGSDESPPTGTSLPTAWRDGSKLYRVPPGGTSAANFAIAAEPPPETEPAKKSKRTGRPKQGNKS